jgi:hypothetical protein
MVSNRRLLWVMLAENPQRNGHADIDIDIELSTQDNF